MKPMDEQFADILKPRLSLVQQKVGEDTAKLISERMKQNTMRGHGFANDPYDSTYSRSHSRRRKKLGLQVGKVDLRMNRRRIERTTETTEAGGTYIRFVEGGEIFKYHHAGTAKGGKTRSIFPKSPQSIPDDIKNDIVQKVQEVLIGQK